MKNLSNKKFADAKHGRASRTPFVMDALMLWKEMLVGFFIAGLLMVVVPDDWWKNLFISQGDGSVRLVENTIVGSLIGVASFACSCGNIPLASVLWSGGIGFGGVISFIYADLIIIPLIFIYRKYYGTKAALYITGVLFVSMVSAGIIVDLLFGAFGLIPNVRPPSAIAEASFQWNYTTLWLDFCRNSFVRMAYLDSFQNKKSLKMR